jgi:hypothetical protein
VGLPAAAKNQNASIPSPEDSKLGQQGWFSIMIDPELLAQIALFLGLISEGPKADSSVPAPIPPRPGGKIDGVN